MAGSNLNHDVGYLDFGRTGSLDMIVILNEVIDQVRRLYKGIPVNDTTLALDVIREVGAEGNFLVHPHTLETMQTTQWRPELINRMGYDKWQAAGGTSLLARAQKKRQRVLREHQPVPLPADKAGRIRELVDQFQPK
jgi:trimethylamine--corrinoid protein Co-methyltransferase